MAPPDAKAPAGGRLHHLDWARSVMIMAVVYCHSLQTLTRVPRLQVDNAHFWPEAPANATLPEPVESSYDLRWLQSARPFTLPGLFYISGAALSFGRSLWPTFRKLLTITCAGMLVNLAILMVDPRDPACGFRDVPDLPRCAREGWLLSFMIAPYAGLVFPVLYQFWYTLFLMAFIVQDTVLYSTLRKLQEAEPGRVCLRGGDLSSSSSSGSGGDESDAAEVDRPSVGGALALAGVRWVAVSCWYVALTFVGVGEEDKVPPGEMAFLIGFEALCSALLVLSAASHGVTARLWQYAFVLAASFQFSVPNFHVTTFDGNTVLYFHLFRQFVALGFLTTLTRKVTPPVISRAWPLMLVVLLHVMPSTNFYLAGVFPFPAFPRFFDRFLVLSGAFIAAMMFDRVGRSLASAGEAEGAGYLPEPNFLGTGTMVAYVVHPLLIVLLVQLPVLESGNPRVMWIAILLICCGGVGCWDLRRRLPR